MGEVVMIRSSSAPPKLRNELPVVGSHRQGDAARRLHFFILSMDDELLGDDQLDAFLYTGATLDFELADWIFSFIEVLPFPFCFAPSELGVWKCCCEKFLSNSWTFGFRIDYFKSYDDCFTRGHLLLLHILV